VEVPTALKRLAALSSFMVPNVDDDARITEIREKLSDHNLSLHLSGAAAAAAVAAEGRWTATIKPKPPLVSPQFEAVGDTPREAAEGAYAMYLGYVEVLSTERTSRPKDEPEVDTSNDPDV
jgi:hypothetical protein